jgi:hypothetical protein
MKKMITLILVLVMATSMCACSGTYVNENGEKIHVKHGETVFETSGEFIITKMDVSMYHVDNNPAKSVYTMVCQNDQYAFICSVNAKDYAMLNVGDAVNGKLVATYSAGQQDLVSNFTMGNSIYAVTWYGEVK